MVCPVVRVVLLGELTLVYYSRQVKPNSKIENDTDNLEVSRVTNFSVLCLNIRSIRGSHYDQFRLFLSDMSPKPAIIVLTETWLTIGEENGFPLPGYACETRIRENKAGGGVSIYIHNDLVYSPVLNSSYVDFRSAESLFVKLVHPSSKKEILLCGLYRPFFGSQKCEEFQNDLEILLNKVTGAGESCIIAGDFNLDYLSTDKTVTQYIGLLGAYGFNNAIQTPTRGSACLDHILSNLRDVSVQGRVLPCDISDHDASVAVIDDFQKFFNITNNARRKVFSFKNYNLNEFREFVQNSSLAEVLEINDPDSAYDLLHNKMKSVCMRYECLSPNSKVIPIRQPYVTMGLAISSKHKNKLYKMHKQKPDDVWLKNRYKIYKGIFTKLLAAAKKTFYSNKF